MQEVTEIVLLHNAHGSSPEILVCIFIDMLTGIVVDIAVQLDTLQLGVCMRLCDTFQHIHTDKALWVVECNTQGRGTFLVLICVFESLYECCVFNVRIVIFVSFLFLKTHLCDIHNCHYCYSHSSMPCKACPHIFFLTVCTFGTSESFHGCYT